MLIQLTYRPCYATVSAVRSIRVQPPCPLLIRPDGMTNSFGVFQEYYTYTHPIHTSVDATAISWIGSIQYTLCPLLGCIAGPLFDAGYLKSLIFAGGGLYVFSLMMTSIATQYWQIILAHGLGVGLGMGLFFSPSVSTLSHHFQRSRYRTVAYGLQATGSSIGGIVYPIMMRALIPRVGFGWAMRICKWIWVVLHTATKLILQWHLSF